MMTRQGLSYTLWGMPVAAAVLHGIQRRLGGREKAFWRSVAQFAAAAMIAGAIWTPFLVVHLQADAAENGG